MFRSVVCLAGGVGAARFLDGLAQVLPPEKVTAVVNTGDDLDYLGIHISPDIDIVTYTLAGIVDAERDTGSGETLTTAWHNSNDTRPKHGSASETAIWRP